MTREEATEMLKALNMMLRNSDGEPISDVCDALDMAIKALSAEPKKAAPPSLADVYKWERDIALSQLEEYGIGFAEKKRDDLVEVVRCKDCRFCANYTDGHRECRLLKNLKTVPCTYVLVDGNDYCSHGERREP